MEVDFVRRYCMALHHTTETVQWGANLVFKIAGKMYAMAELEAADHWLSFKCSPEDFAELCEREGIIPAPYLARAQWVTLRDGRHNPEARVEAPAAASLRPGLRQTSQEDAGRAEAIAPSQVRKSRRWQAKACPTTAPRLLAMVGHALAC